MSLFHKLATSSNTTSNNDDSTDISQMSISLDSTADSRVLSFSEKLRMKSNNRPNTPTFNVSPGKDALTHNLSQFFSMHKKNKQMVNESLNEESDSKRIFQSKKPPCDLVIKSSMKIFSRTEFPWSIDYPISPHQYPSCIHSFMNKSMSFNDPTPNIISDNQEIVQELESCLMLWKYQPKSNALLVPGPMNKEELSLSVSNSTLLSVNNANLDEWISSFRSVYYSFINAVDSFQFCLQMNKWDAWMYFIRSSRASDPMIIVSRSFTRLRSSLREYGIAFELPLRIVSPEDQEYNTNHSLQEDELDEDILEYEKSTGISLSQPITTNLNINNTDKSENSILVVKGSRNIHLFYDFMLNDSIIGTLPTIYSWSPFDNGQISSLKTQMRQTKIPSSESGELQSMNVLEVTGPILPLNMHRILTFADRYIPGEWEFSTMSVLSSSGISQIISESSLSPSNIHVCTDLVDKCVHIGSRSPLYKW